MEPAEEFMGKHPIPTEETAVKASGPKIEFYAFEKTPGPEDQVELDALWERLNQKTDADKYRHIQGVPYTPPPNHGGYTVIDVLQHLWGLPMNDLIMGYVHALRPSWVSITGGEQTLDAMPWRVTITVDEHDNVAKIQQEVQIAYGCGYDLDSCVWAKKSNGRPRAITGPIGHVSGLERVDFS